MVHGWNVWWGSNRWADADESRDSARMQTHRRQQQQAPDTGQFLCALVRLERHQMQRERVVAVRARWPTDEQEEVVRHWRPATGAPLKPSVSTETASAQASEMPPKKLLYELLNGCWTGAPDLKSFVYINTNKFSFLSTFVVNLMYFKKIW